RGSGQAGPRQQGRRLPCASSCARDSCRGKARVRAAIAGRGPLHRSGPCAAAAPLRRDTGSLRRSSGYGVGGRTLFFKHTMRCKSRREPGNREEGTWRDLRVNVSFKNNLSRGCLISNESAPFTVERKRGLCLSGGCFEGKPLRIRVGNGEKRALVDA